jgi:hypothetical protein
MDDRLRCQCRRWPRDPCGQAMTQEDLLCDACRHGCWLLRAGGERFHVEVVKWEATLT